MNTNQTNPTLYTLQLIAQLKQIYETHGNLPVKLISYAVAGSSVQPVINADVVVSKRDCPVYVIIESKES